MGTQSAFAPSLRPSVRAAGCDPTRAWSVQIVGPNSSASRPEGRPAARAGARAHAAARRLPRQIPPDAHAATHHRRAPISMPAHEAFTRFRPLKRPSGHAGHIPALAALARHEISGLGRVLRSDLLIHEAGLGALLEDVSAGRQSGHDGRLDCAGPAHDEFIDLLMLPEPEVDEQITLLARVPSDRGQLLVAPVIPDPDADGRPDRVAIDARRRVALQDEGEGTGCPERCGCGRA
jgi:hypothetical protein